MKLYYKVTHIAGDSKIVDTNDYSIGEVIAIYEFYTDRKNYDLEVIHDN